MVMLKPIVKYYISRYLHQITIVCLVFLGGAVVLLG